MPLSAADQAKIAAIKRGDVQQTLASVKQFLAKGLWLSKSNRYGTNTVDRIKSDAKSGSIRTRQLAQYIAVSTVLHCNDGWSYLGRSLGALLRGDPHRARHLAYYAELRAAMSLLASNGIGVFKDQHFVIDGVCSVSPIGAKAGTHLVVWDALLEWSSLPSSGQMFANVVQPMGVRLGEWLLPVGGPAVVAAQAKGWFSQWGMDLSAPAEDRDLRNTSSYRPDGLLNAWSVNGSEVLDFAREFWIAMEPSANNRFETIDRHILRLCLESAFRGRSGKSCRRAPVQFRSEVTRVVLNQGFDPSITDLLIEFLIRERSPDELSLLSWSSIPPARETSTHFSVFSRAALLLRLATGFAQSLEKDVGLTAKDIAFWWEKVGNSRGIWDGRLDPSAILDLWADIEPALGSVENFQSRVAKNNQTLFHATQSSAHELRMLDSCDRIGVWGLIPT